MTESLFTLLIYFCFIYLGLTMIVCTTWVIRDRGKLKAKTKNSETNNKTVNL